mmetsp:Transcript_3188/g.5588  ORF Transcript_3188/g.5588 Transcript_3188/m.5588 type:complete len:219 (+) Transcript_3188:96-752(+)
MWEQDSSKYWEEIRRKKKIKQALFACGAIIITTTTVAALYAFGLLTKEIKEKLGEPAQQEPIEILWSLDQEAECKERVHSGSHAQHYNQACVNICGYSKQMLPRPAVYRACASGCRQGYKQQALYGCEREDVPETDWTSICENPSYVKPKSKGYCQSACQEFREAHPRPTIMDFCVEGCQKAAGDGCRWGAGQLAEVLAGRRATAAAAGTGTGGGGEL